ncbi:MAG TPA: 1-deoxy-D-xylulose-5-phosphate synthase [Candidatus Limnocylindria bacterium]|nr:1-deoxy-D-xylulose-5-phosphate synthase [Candidatus Limnocylindria bacterium]
MSLLESLNGPADLRQLDGRQLLQLCAEIRVTIIRTVASTGGHLGSSLGVVELSVALHRLLDSPTDKLVWDTGHQAYAHKLLTGRLGNFGTLRQLGGVGGFPRRSESEHDVFDGGHAGTGLSIAEGLALARDQRGGTERIVVVVGDAALISGMALEALNDIGHRRTRLLIVLNDNEMSISPTVGALSQYLSRIKLSRTWRGSKRMYDDFVERLPLVGPAALEWSRRLRKSVVNFAQPGQLFEDLGITYVGPVPGHSLVALDGVFRRALRDMDGPVIVHVRTEKGRGYQPAVADKVSFHGAALPPMTVVPGGQSGAPSQASVERGDGDATPSMAQAVAARSTPPNYTRVMAQELIALGRQDPRIVAITAGMPTGTGLSKFQAVFPERMYDVGISEQHALTLATGLALGGMRPYVALYSTFLQRAFDQLVHDACQNDQPVVIGVDRAGLVGEDGTSHQGMFALPAQRQLPNIVIASPKDEQELRRLLHTAFGQNHPFALHYPRDPGLDLPPIEPTPIPVGEAELLRDGDDLLIVGFGPIVMRGLAAAEQLAAEGWSVAVVNARFAKPLDAALIARQALGKRLIVTLEESVVSGGFGSAVLEALNEAGLEQPELRSVPLRRLGLPSDRFVDHGSVADLRSVLRLDTPGIVEQLREALAGLNLEPAPGSREAASATAAAARRKRSA